VRNWLNRGRTIARALEDEDDPLTITQLQLLTDNSIHYFKFYLDYREAESQHKASLENESTTRALEGSEKVVTREVLVTHPDTGAILARHEIIDSRTVTRDGKLARELLAVADPDTYAPMSKSVIKHTGTGDGGEIEVTTTNTHVDLKALLESAPVELQQKWLALFDELHKRVDQQVIETEANPPTENED
jgi:hypothetical protein